MGALSPAMPSRRTALLKPLQQELRDRPGDAAQYRGRKHADDCPHGSGYEVDQPVDQLRQPSVVSRLALGRLLLQFVDLLLGRPRFSGGRSCARVTRGAKSRSSSAVLRPCETCDSAPGPIACPVPEISLTVYLSLPTLSPITLSPRTSSP